MTTLASTAAAQLAYLKEITVGVIPAGTPKALRMTGESLAFDVTTESSKEINKYRQIADAVQVDADGAGDINIELSYREYDPFLEALLTNTFDTTFAGATGVKSMTLTVDTTITAESLGTPDGVIVTFSGTLAGAGPVLSSVVIDYVIGTTAYQATTDSSGTITGTSITSGSVTSAGVYTITFSTAPDDLSALTADYSYAGTITDDGVDGFSGLQPGDWFSIKGDTVATNDGVYLIASMTNDELTLDPSTPVKAEASALVANISSSRLAIGTDSLVSYTIEKAFTDVSQFFAMTGLHTSKLDLNFATGDFVTGAFGFMGTGSSRSDTTQFSASPTTSESYGIMNAVSGVGLSGGLGGILLRDSGGVNLLADTYIQSMSVSIDGALRTQKGIGKLGAVGVASGTFAVTGVMELYLASGTIYDKALADELVSITFPVKDSSGNGYAFTFDNVKLDVPNVLAESIDTDVMLSVSFTAVAPVQGTDSCVKISRFGAAI